MSRTSSASGLSNSRKNYQRRHYLTTSSPHHSWLGKTRRFGPAYLRALSAERRPTNCRTRSAEAFLSNIIFTTAEHNELRLRPLTHDWAPRKYECCLAVVERPYGKAPSSTHHQQPQPAKVNLLWRFCGWPSLLGGLQKRSGTFEHRSTAMIIQAKIVSGNSPSVNLRGGVNSSRRATILDTHRYSTYSRLNISHPLNPNTRRHLQSLQDDVHLVSA
ncbi:BQ5605_C002g01703 [Microbotryum silenes-dioicae]|uniref:BQ5605_C002g01703 protein n=1 Tax=Microbotryum silenes-dioicae TaxID=796604 RepID=A0A2X0LZM7_9BASI|nr:BQ5605_C002g01703 [Microbotryum silenes-dioicae]